MKAKELKKDKEKIKSTNKVGASGKPIKKLSMEEAYERLRNGECDGSDVSRKINKLFMEVLADGEEEKAGNQSPILKNDQQQPHFTPSSLFGKRNKQPRHHTLHNQSEPLIQFRRMKFQTDEDAISQNDEEPTKQVNSIKKEKKGKKDDKLKLKEAWGI